MDKAIEVMRFVRISPEGQLVLEVRGRRFAKLSDIPDDRVRKVLLNTIRDFIEQGCDASDLEALGFGDASPLAAADRPLQEIQEMQESPAEQEDAFLRSLVQPSERSAPSEVRSGSLLDRFRARSRVESEMEQSLPTLNIGRQVHDLVQQQKANFPELADRTINIRQDHTGGLKIMVDNENFDDVAQISDPQVRMVIKSAIQIWENSN